MQPSPQHRVSVSETWIKLYKQGWRSLLGIAVLAITPLLFAQSTVDTPSNVAEQFLLAAANQDRVARGLKPLRHDPILAQAALSHAREMAAHRGISHRFPGELQLSARGATAGARFSLITENVAQAPISAMIHDLWMGSNGHRENILDPNVDTVGIAVVVRDHEYYAVEDFASNVMPLTVDAQETAVSDLVAKSGMKIANGKVMSEQDARQTCSMNSGYAGSSTPWYIMRYTAHDVTELPSQLLSRLNSGRYSKAVVSACSEKTAGPFTAYNIAVLLYP